MKMTRETSAQSAPDNGSAEQGDEVLTQKLRDAAEALSAAHREAAQRQGKNPDAPDGDR